MSDDDYRLRLTYLGLYRAEITGTQMYDYCPPISSLGITAKKAIRRVRAKADRKNARQREIRLKRGYGDGGS